MDYAIEILLEQKGNIELELMTTEGNDRIPLEKRLIDICNALNKLNLPDVTQQSELLKALTEIKDCCDGTEHIYDVAENAINAFNGG